MKKLGLIALCFAACMSATAQMSLVKDAQKSFKNGDKYEKWLATIQPAFTNPESATQAMTYYVPAKEGYANFDHLLVLARAGQDVDFANMGNSIINGYKFALKALPLDSVPDAKGKIKTKYSKELVNLITSHYGDYDMAARFLYNAKEWAKAADAWDIYFEVAQSPRFADKIKLDPDSTRAENAYLQAYVVSMMEDYPRSLQLFNRAIDLGAKDKNMFQQATYVAKMANDLDQMYAIAEKAYKVLGTSEPLYFQLCIEGKLRKKQYDEAKDLLNKALATEPNNAVYNIAMGALLEEQGDSEGALNYYKNAAEKDPTSAMAFKNYGRALAEKSDKIAEGVGSGVSEAEFHRIEREQINPLRRQAAEAFEKAYALNSDDMDALRYLKQIYYVLGDNANFERVNNLLY